MAEPDHHSATAPTFRLWPLILVVLSLLLGISVANQWYAENMAMPRYCEDPTKTLERVRRLLTERQPTDNNFNARRPYIIAAKLLFLIPKRADEDDDAYLRRIRKQLEQRCL